MIRDGETMAFVSYALQQIQGFRASGDRHRSASPHYEHFFKFFGQCCHRDVQADLSHHLVCHA